MTATRGALKNPPEGHPHHRVLAAAPVVELDPTAPIEDAAEEPEPEIEWDWFTETVLVDVTPDNFSRIAGQTAKQVLRQRINESYRSMIFYQFAYRLSVIVTCIVQHAYHRYSFFDLLPFHSLLPVSL